MRSPMSQQTYLKVPFVWEEPQPLIDVPSRLTFESVKAVDDRLTLLRRSRLNPSMRAIGLEP
jgi:hypothetical protein